MLSHNYVWLLISICLKTTPKFTSTVSNCESKGPGGKARRADWAYKDLAPNLPNDRAHQSPPEDAAPLPRQRHPQSVTKGSPPLTQDSGSTRPASPGAAVPHKPPGAHCRLSAPRHPILRTLRSPHTQHPRLPALPGPRL